jgi:hypothetical protein
VKGRLSSPRFRRRLAWIGGAACVVSAVVVGSIHIGNTGHSNATPIDHTRKPWVYREPKSMVLTKRDRLDLFRTSSQFVQTAVARRHLDDAWDMLGPEMKAGQTRKSWDTGFNNVIPFKADGIDAWDVLYAYDNDVALDLSLVSRGKNENDWAGKTFTLELKRSPGHPHHWLVAAWVPKGIGGGGTLSPSRRSGPPPPPVKAKLSAKWIFVPGAFLGGLLLLLALWGVQSVVRGRRATRRYAEALGYNSSSNPS